VGIENILHRFISIYRREDETGAKLYLLPVQAILPANPFSYIAAVATTPLPFHPFWWGCRAFQDWLQAWSRIGAAILPG
jgi:hypothetical protein